MTTITWLWLQRPSRTATTTTAAGLGCFSDGSKPPARLKTNLSLENIIFCTTVLNLCVGQHGWFWRWWRLSRRRRRERIHGHHSPDGGMSAWPRGLGAPATGVGLWCQLFPEDHWLGTTDGGHPQWEGGVNGWLDCLIDKKDKWIIMCMAFYIVSHLKCIYTLMHASLSTGRVFFLLS